MKQNFELKKVADIVQRELPNPDFARLIKNVLNTGTEEGKVLVRNVRKCKTRNEAIQACYNLILDSEGLFNNIGGTEIDKCFIKRKDRKAGWWD